MKTCIVRRRFWATEADNASVEVDLEPGFGTAKGIIVFYLENSATTDAFDTTLQDRNIGIGFAQATLSTGFGATTNTTMHIALRDNVATTDSSSAHFTSRLINAYDVPARATSYYRCDSVTFLTDKLRFTFANGTPQANGHLDAIIWAITGDDISVGVGYTTFSSASGSSRALSGLGFQPDVLFISSIYNTINSNANGTCTLTFGAATRDPLVQCTSAFNFSDNSATNTSQVESGSQEIFSGSTGAGVGATVQFTATGWNMFCRNAFGTNIAYNYFAIKGASPFDFDLVNFSTPTATGNLYTGLGTSGFVPETILGTATYCSAQNAMQTASNTGADGYSFIAGMASTHSKLYNGNGTITYSTASSTVTGTGSTFWKLVPGYRLSTPDGDSIGVVSTVSSATSLTLTASPSINGTTQNYTYSPHQQCALSFANDDNTVNTRITSYASSFAYAVTDANAPTLRIKGYFNTPDTRPGFELNFTTVDASARFGFVMAFKSATRNRRRGSQT